MLFTFCEGPGVNFTPRHLGAETWEFDSTSSSPYWGFPPEALQSLSQIPSFEGWKLKLPGQGYSPVEAKV